jgi:hypothetical protein
MQKSITRTVSNAVNRVVSAPAVALAAAASLPPPPPYWRQGVPEGLMATLVVFEGRPPLSHAQAVTYVAGLPFEQYYRLWARVSPEACAAANEKLQSMGYPGDLKYPPTEPQIYGVTIPVGVHDAETTDSGVR